jgi:hypothetical protein
MVRYQSSAQEFTTKDTEGHREKRERRGFVTDLSLAVLRVLRALCVEISFSSTGLASIYAQRTPHPTRMHTTTT